MNVELQDRVYGEENRAVRRTGVTIEGKSKVKYRALWIRNLIERWTHQQRSKYLC